MFNTLKTEKTLLAPHSRYCGN